MDVLEVVPVVECTKKTQMKPTRGRWVDVNKGDDQVEVYRSRYVAMDLKHQYGGALRDGLFAAIPPHEGMRFLPSYVASRQGRKLPHKLVFIDISKACLLLDVLNDSIYVELPGEITCGQVWKAPASLVWDQPSRQSLGGGVH